ncbi:MAG: S-layer homology domain-containing protein [Firmicutes bacterium]|nr:S-layer homology domain-containing protein [Bacillota bacterium]
MKKVTSFVLALAMILSGSVMAFAATDTVGTPYDEAVNALIEKGYVSGYTDGTYRPNNNINRAEAASIIVNFVGATKEDLAAATVADFTDMDTHKWAIPAVSYAVEQGILSGYTDGTFRPGNDVTYAELAVMIVNAMGQKDQVTGQWAEGYMAVAKDKGYLDGTVNVDAKKDISTPAIRGNVAVMVHNADERKALEDATVERPATPLSEFSGYAFGAINGFSQVLNEEDDVVYEVEFVFGDGVQYLKTKDDKLDLPTLTYDGTLYVMQMRNGEVSKIATEGSFAGANMKLGKFVELTSGYQEVSKKADPEILYVTSGSGVEMIDLNMDLYSIYVATNDGKDATSGGAIDGYRPGDYRDISKGDWVRAYDVTKEDVYTDVLFVLKK